MKRLPRHREVSLTECMCYVRPHITTTPSSEDPHPGESQQTPSLTVIRDAGYQIPMVAVIFFFSLVLTVRDIFIHWDPSCPKTYVEMSEMQKPGGSI